jgi:cell wall-associated NlpC family hydrolase
VWYDWPQQIKRDALREKFLAWGGRWVAQPQTGDLLFICLRYAPVDHLGLCLNTHEFVHLVKRGLRLDGVADYERRIIAVGRL